MPYLVCSLPALNIKFLLCNIFLKKSSLFLKYTSTLHLHKFFHLHVCTTDHWGITIVHILLATDPKQWSLISYHTALFAYLSYRVIMCIYSLIFKQRVWTIVHIIAPTDHFPVISDHQFYIILRLQGTIRISDHPPSQIHWNTMNSLHCTITLFVLPDKK